MQKMLYIRVYRKEEKSIFWRPSCLNAAGLPASLTTAVYKKGTERIVEMKRKRGLNEGGEEIGERGFMERELEEGNMSFTALFSRFFLFIINVISSTYNQPDLIKEDVFRKRCI